MGTRTSYTPGTFSWIDLATTDASAAEAFYGGLFGWTTVTDADPDGNVVYATFRLGDDAVAGLYERPDETPAWASYVTVDDADATAARATELGGTVGEAFDVFDAGRMVVITDPQGGVFALWQPGARIGAERVNDVGCLTMNELLTPDLDGARAFYEGLFGWRTEPIDTGPGGPQMRSVYNGETLNATLTLDDTGPTHWRPYVTVESTTAALEQITALGGSALAGPIPLPDGSFAIALDPQGAEFAIFEGEVDP